MVVSPQHQAATREVVFQLVRKTPFIWRECYNANNVILAGREDAAKRRQITHHQGWNEATFCREAIEEKKLVISKMQSSGMSAVKKCLGRFVDGNATQFHCSIVWTLQPPTQQRRRRSRLLPEC